jgi:hypothetical protein
MVGSFITFREFANMLMCSEVGGNGGSPFNHSDFDAAGALLRRIEVWAGDSSLVGVSSRLSNGREFVAGSTSWGASKAFEFEDGERISRLSLWGNGIGTRAGWIEFDTSHGRRFSHGMTGWGRKTEYHLDVGSGLCAGVQIDSIGFQFVKPLESATVIDLQYPLEELDNFTQGSREIIAVEHDNQSDVPVTFTERAKYTHTDSNSFSVGGGAKAALEYAKEWSFNVQIPIFSAKTTQGSKSTFKISGELTTNMNRTTSTTDTSEREFVASIPVPPKTCVRYQATIITAQIALDFTAFIQLRATDGETKKLPITGRYQGVKTSNVLEEVH